ncbi:MAG: KUP/HAK/KT family potassium transporter, partial [Gillisia sp.]
MLILTMGLFGAALLYGDGMITPAISVLSATEGLKVATPFFEPYVVIITVVILIGLFIFQKRGTQGVGMIFGPLILLWFVTIATLGVASIIKTPEILKAANPYYAFEFFKVNHWHGIFILGAVFLVVTGGEALYADIGHFGKKPIRWGWFTVVLPCLLMNYFGQGALLLRDTGRLQNPFYHLAPEWALYPLVILATIATIIASQAIITGAFSLTFQALQLGYFPRVKVVHTSEEEEGQIYMPHINWMIFIGTITLVLAFQTSSNLAAAYGIAVTTTMVITTILAFIAMRKLWKWKLPVAIMITIFLLCIDLSFLYANIDKIPDGGWVPLTVAALIYFIMTTWSKGRRLLSIELTKIMVPIKRFIRELDEKEVTRIPLTAIYFSKSPDRTPPALVQNFKSNMVIHDQVVILSVNFKSVPHVPPNKRVLIKPLGKGFYRLLISYGYMDRTNLPQTIAKINDPNLKIDLENVVYCLGRETVIVNGKVGMPEWRESVFSFLARNSQRATRYFNLPPNKVLEVGTNIEM